MSIQGQFPMLLLAGKILSAIVILLLLLAILDIWRRRSFPDVSYGRISLSQKRLRVVWFLVLIGAFGVGINEEPIAVSTQTMEDEEVAAAATTTKIVGVSLPLPFYRYGRQRVYGDGALVKEDVVESILIPWSLLWALLAYFVLVVRWDSESKMARRILRGRRWREAEEDHRAKDQHRSS